MPSESQMWSALRPHMEREGLDPVRVENRAMPGTPDVNYKEGWLELKHADRWPPRGGPLRLKHPPTPEQKVWLWRRWMKAGAAMLLLRVGREWFLFRGSEVREVWIRGIDAPHESTIRDMAMKTFNSPAEVAVYLKKFERFKW